MFYISNEGEAANLIELDDNLRQRWHELPFFKPGPLLARYILPINRNRSGTQPPKLKPFGRKVSNWTTFERLLRQNFMSSKLQLFWPHKKT